MNFSRESLVLIATIAYFIGLSFSIYEKAFEKKLSKLVLLGLVFGFFAANVVMVIIKITHYDQLPTLIVAVVYAPIVEELIKFLTIFYLGFLLQGTVSQLEIIRLGGGLGLGFGSLETLGYIVDEIGYYTTIGRLLVTSSFHISSALLIGVGLTKRKFLILLPLVILFHSLSNLLAVSNVRLQGILSWVALSTLYCFSEVGHNIKLHRGKR